MIWNGSPRYILIGDQGGTTELLVDQELVKPFGGPLAINRKRVTIIGETVDKPSGAVRVLSINVDQNEGQPCV